MKLQIRSIQLEDARRIRELAEQLGYPATDQETESRITQCLSLQHNKAFVAIDDLEVVGWIYAFRSFSIESNSYVEIGGLVVDENHRGKGIGKQLIEKVKNWSLLQGIHELRVRTNIRRVESQSFYSSLG